MNKNQRDTLATCLTQVFGRVEDEFVDAAAPLLEWIELAGGETLFEEGDAENGVYFVISGRLRALVDREGEPRVIGEIGRGETVGEMAVLTGEPRSATVRAIRDTVLAHATREAFEALWKRHPELPVHMAKIIISRLKRKSERQKISRPATICLLRITDGVDIDRFAGELVSALDRWGVATVESSARIDERFGAGASQATPDNAETSHKVNLWLDDVEFWNEFVLLVADESDTEWTRRCLRHADEILLVASTEAQPAIHEVEAKLCMGRSAATGAHQTLVLVHDRHVTNPMGTPRWLDQRPVDAHLHLRRDAPGSMQRLARIVSRNAIGLVLAGGGARGFAHLGVYKALEEFGVEIDYVAGTSIGAVMAAYVSFDLSAASMIHRAKEAFAGNPTGDLNVIPFHSLVRGKRLKRTIDRAVVDAIGFSADVTDCWKTLRCVATNFSQACEQVISRGRLDRTVRASVSIPVALPPVPWDGDLLIDGGVFNNFPTSVMAALGARQLIGVDLASRKERKYEHDEVPGTLALLRDRLRSRKRRKYRLPGLGAILMGTTILYSESRREEAKQSVDIYINPDVGGVALLDWTAFDRIVELGYRRAKEILSSMSERELAPFRNVPAS
jgi:NTE family protein